MRVRKAVSFVVILISLTTALLSTARADSFGSGTNNFDIDFVLIGDSGNAPDTNGYGSIPYSYRIATYEVSKEALRKAITSGMQNVTVGNQSDNRPAASISWYEVAAFVNWLNTSTGHQAAYNLVYDGVSWTMNLWSSAEAWQQGGENRFRHKDARYFLPSENEWYKAAYYNANAGGYSLYATASSTAPLAVGSGTASGTAVYNGITNAPAAVTAVGGLSFYSTAGQNGNVNEYLETAFDGSNDSTSENRVVRGGSWLSPASNLRSSARFAEGVIYEPDHTGFRVASVLLPPPDNDGDGVNNYREILDGTDPDDPTALNPLSIGLVAHYPLAGTLSDQSGWGNDLRHQADMTYEIDRAGIPNNSLRLLGPASYAESSAEIGISGNQARTMSFWIKPDAYSYYNAGIVAIGDGSAVTQANTLFYSTANSPQFQVWGNYLDVGTTVLNNFEGNKWHHVVYVHEATVSQGKFYINGSLIGTVSGNAQYGNGDSWNTAPSKLSIGKNKSYFSAANMGIDELRVYGRALHPNEVQKLYYAEAFTDAQRAFLTSHPFVMGHYSLDEYSANRTNGQTDVTTSPSAFNLFTQDQFNSNRHAGQLDVISNPMSYGLYTADSIMDLRMGGLMIQKQGTNAVVSFQSQTTTDLNLPFTNNGTPITNTIPMPGNKGFIRINAKP